MVIFSPIPGQEERNSDHLLEDGVAIKCNELTTIPFKIDRLLDQPERLDAMRRAARLFGRPDAAKTIVETLLDDQLPPLVLDDEQREAMTQAAAGETV
jgi:processive 1,2-diacylglycerol beta-glucosyltransferase